MGSYPENIFKDATVVIPAAGGSRDVLGRISDFPAALIRLGSKPIIYLSIEYLIEQGFRNFRIGVQKSYLSNFQSTLKSFEPEADIEFYEGVPGESSIGTIKRLIDGLPESSPILINLGDTLCKWDTNLLKNSSTAILLEKVPETERWSTASLDDENFVTKIFEKGNLSSGVFGICGVYWWQSASQLFSVFPKNLAGAEISDVLYPFVGKAMRGITPEVWCDSDHGDMRENSRHRILESRSFNRIEIDDFRGTIKKSSTNAEKLKMEIEYYKNLPSQLKIFFPRMLDYSVVPEKVSQVLEYYSYPTLSEIYCYEDAPNFVWKRVLGKLSRITFDEFSSHGQQVVESQPTLREVFIDKTKLRNLELAKRDDELSTLLSAHEIKINTKKYKGVHEILSQSKKVVDSLSSHNSVIHGDFCLSNILCEPDSNNIKLIDPRGGFSEASCFGPQLYDVAKLGHSLVGRYDLIIADKFVLDLSNLENSEIRFEILETASHSEIEAEYLNTYLNGRVAKPVAKLLSGLILLSIPIFHLDRVDRATAMILQGIRLTNEALRELA
jgi:dTDP-glucose pyrophosphorylase